MNIAPSAWTIVVPAVIALAVGIWLGDMWRAGADAERMTGYADRIAEMEAASDKASSQAAAKLAAADADNRALREKLDKQRDTLAAEYDAKVKAAKASEQAALARLANLIKGNPDVATWSNQPLPAALRVQDGAAAH